MLKKFQDFIINEKKQVVDPITARVREYIPREIWNELLSNQKELLRTEVGTSNFYDFAQYASKLVRETDSQTMRYWTRQLSRYRTLPELTEYTRSYLSGCETDVPTEMGMFEYK